MHLVEEFLIPELIDPFYLIRGQFVDLLQLHDEQFSPYYTLLLQLHRRLERFRRQVEPMLLLRRRNRRGRVYR